MAKYEKIWIRNFNYNHPERKKGESFLVNGDEDAFCRLMWRTKRKGKQVYDIYGNPLKFKNDFPIFVRRSELDDNGINPEQLGWIRISSKL